MFHISLQKQVQLATVYYPIVGGDYVCCGHEVIGLKSETAHVSLEDSEDRKTQPALKLNS